MITRSAIAFLLVTTLLGQLPRSSEPPAQRDRDCAAEHWRQLGIRVLDCDPRGRGLIVLALGDPTTARNVAVIVPGVDVDLGHLEDPVDPHRGSLGWARALHSAAAAGGEGGDLAVVLWVGYRTPRTGRADALFGAAARSGAPALSRFLIRVRAAHRGPVHLSVVGHSYGAVVATTAAATLPLGAEDDLLLLGSPGAGVASVAELGTPARVWAGRARTDWVRWVPPVRIGDLGHGPDPADPAFGAQRLDTGGVPGHDRYFVPGSAALAGLVEVVLRPSSDTGPGSRADHRRT